MNTPPSISEEIIRNYEAARQAAEEIRRSMEETIRKIDETLARVSDPQPKPSPLPS